MERPKGGLAVFICGSSKVNALRPCVSCGGHSFYICDFALRGRLKGQRCERALCETHVVTEGRRHYCLVHAQMMEQERRV